VRELYRSAAAVLEPLTHSSRLALSDVRALRALDLVADGLPAGRLGAELGLSSGATTALLDRLEAAGLILREQDATDRRRVIARLSPHARQTAGVRLDQIDQRLGAAVAATSLSDLAAVTRFLSQLTPDSSATARPRTTARPD